MNETLTPYLESAGNCMKFECEGLSAPNLWKSDFVKRLATFDYSVLFLLPKEHAASCYSCLFNSFSAKCRVARELMTLHIEEFIDLVDDLRCAYIVDDSHGLTVGDMVTFMIGCPALWRREKTLTIFRLSCLCHGHFPSILPTVKFGSAVSSSSGPELFEIIEPVQSYLLACNAEKNIFIDPISVNGCVDLLDVLAGTALHIGYDVWTHVDFCDKELILKNSVSNYKESHSAQCVVGENLNISGPETLCVQKFLPRQPL